MYPQGGIAINMHTKELADYDLPNRPSINSQVQPVLRRTNIWFAISHIFTIQSYQNSKSIYYEQNNPPIYPILNLGILQNPPHPSQMKKACIIRKRDAFETVWCSRVAHENKNRTWDEGPIRTEQLPYFGSNASDRSTIGMLYKTS